MRALLRAPAVRVAFLSRLVAHSNSDNIDDTDQNTKGIHSRAQRGGKNGYPCLENLGVAPQKKVTAAALRNLIFL